MKRINYLLTWTERRAGIALPAFAPAFRAPLLALACALALVAVLWAVQQARLASLQSGGAEFEQRLAALDVQTERVRGIERELTRLRLLEARIAAIRRSGPLRANEIATLGNQLPGDTWLTSLRADRSSLALEGRGARIEAVAAALAALARLPAYGAARLLSVREAPPGNGVSYALALDSRP